MAKQHSFMRLIGGSIGDITYVKSKNGYRAQKKLTISPDRFNNDPAFVKVRENAGAFSRAGTAGKVIRNAISSILKYSSDNRVSNRLMQCIMKVIKEDKTKPPGHGSIINGPIELLKGFEFNAKALISQVFYRPVTSTINQVTGELTVTIPAFVPAQWLRAPNHTTHYQFILAGSEIDFEREIDITEIKESEYLPYNSAKSEDLSLVAKVTPDSSHPLFLFFGVKFFQECGGIKYPMLSANANFLTIVNVSKAE